jgi:hypothetical protein
MKLYWIELLDGQVPLALRRRGLLQLSGLALVVQLFHLGLAWLALPEMAGLPLWLVWAVSSFFALLLLVIGVLYFRPEVRKPRLEPARKAFLSALWLGVACLAAIFAARMGFDLGVALFLALGLVGYGAAFGDLWFGLNKA